MQAPWFKPSSLPWLLFSFEGRIPRRTWWLWSVAAMLGLGLYFTVLLQVAGISAASTERLVNLLLLWPTVALNVKRWHDRNKSAWWVLLLLAPVIGWLWTLVENGLLRGTVGANRFGDAPGDETAVRPHAGGDDPGALAKQTLAVDA